MMKYAACTTAVLALLLAGSTAQPQTREYKGQSLDLLRLLAEKPWIGFGPHNRWDRAPRIDADLGLTPNEPRPQLPINIESRLPSLEPRLQMPGQMDPRLQMASSLEGHLSHMPSGLGPRFGQLRDNEENYWDDEIRSSSDKRSAVATALNSGRRRRQPTPALGKAVSPYVSVGVLNDMGSFFDSLRDNLETLVSLSPQERSSLFQDPPHVVHAPVANNGGGGSGARKLYALRPLRPTGNIRSYNRRSFVEADGVYPGANHHDPGLLWTGLGR